MKGVFWSFAVGASHPTEIWFPACLGINPSASIIWGIVWSLNFQNLHFLLVGVGYISFWRSNWLGVVLHKDSLSSLTLHEGVVDIERVQTYPMEEQLSHAKSILIAEDVLDMVISAPKNNGQFKVASYIAAYRAARATVSWSNVVWKKIMPQWINSFMWRVYHTLFQWNLILNGGAFNRCQCVFAVAHMSRKPSLTNSSTSV